MLLRIPCVCASEITTSPADCSLPEGFELWALWVKSCDLISWLHIVFCFLFVLFVCPLFWYVFVFSGALIIPGFSELQGQFVYVLAEARGKDSEVLVAEAWDYHLFVCLLVGTLFCLFVGTFLFVFG